MANSIGVKRVQQLRKSLGDESPAIDLRITGVIHRRGSAATPMSEVDVLRVGDTLIGTYVAPDRQFLHARLHLQRTPSPRPSSSSAPTLLGIMDDDRHLNPHGHTGGTWELDTTHMQPGDYTLTLRVVDRTLLGSGTVTRWSGSVTLDFRLAPAAPRA